MKNLAVGELLVRLRSWFPDREFFMRSQGQVRFIKLSSRLQMTVAGIAAALLFGWVATMAAVAIGQYTSARDRLALLDREAKVATAESRVSAYRDNLGKVTSDLQRRQDFIEKMVSSLPSDIKDGETVSNSESEASKAVDKISASLPEAAGLAQIEARQLAFVEGLTRLADRRAAQASQRIRKLGINPSIMLASLDNREAQGGPLFQLSTSDDGSLDPRFERLGVSLARMEALERGLAAVPQVLPASRNYISSGFGYRADPFTRGAAFHAGLDFRGPIGAPIYAAAPGTVSFVGYKQGYGKCVEVSHRNGLVTRYAHMSNWGARVGQKVDAGQRIGAIGSTGRSTGPHLHFEVRLRDRALNPRPFLEAASHVQETTRGQSAANAG